METALYFRHIQVPQSRWFTQLLLYWDDVASIIPISQLTNRRNSLSRYMNELIDVRLLKPISPEHIISNSRKFSVDTFAETFLEIALTAHRSARSEKYSRVHIEKLPYSLFRELESRGLAHRMTGSHEWWLLEESLADLYLSYLAGAVHGASPEIVPVTNSSKGLVRNGPRPELSVDASWANYRYSLIEKALPAPRSDVPPLEIRRFKDDHQEMLHRCKVHIDSMVGQFANLPDKMRNQSMDSISQEIREDFDKLEREMNRRGWPHITWLNFGALTASVVQMTDEFSSSTMDFSSIARALVLGAVQMAPAMHDTMESVRLPRLDTQNPLAYAFMASRI